jgi:F-box domain
MYFDIWNIILNNVDDYDLIHLRMVCKMWKILIDKKADFKNDFMFMDNEYPLLSFTLMPNHDNLENLYPELTVISDIMVGNKKIFHYMTILARKQNHLPINYFLDMLSFASSYNMKKSMENIVSLVNKSNSYLFVDFIKFICKNRCFYVFSFDSLRNDIVVFAKLLNYAGTYSSICNILLHAVIQGCSKITYSKLSELYISRIIYDTTWEYIGMCFSANHLPLI